jgi:hypothetical protein
MYPEVTDITPFNSRNTASMHQKQPAPRVIVSVFAGIDSFMRVVFRTPSLVFDDVLAIQDARLSTIALSIAVEVRGKTKFLDITERTRGNVLGS